VCVFHHCIIYIDIMTEKELFEGEEHTKIYRLYRPDYPSVLFDFIKNFYFSHAQTHDNIPLALDVACGNGQATVALSS
jgi:hypothetical protein